MGLFVIRVKSALTELPTGDGVISDYSTTTNETCADTWSVTALVETSCWVEWTVTDLNCTVEKVSGTAVNGETLTSNTEYTVTIEAYESPNQTLNTEVSSVVFTLKDSDGGTILDQNTYTRYHTGLNC